jgi:hypothetical protein
MFKEWIKAAGIRALRTFAQTFAAAVVIGRFVETDWLAALETAAVAALASLLMSVGGLPELKSPEAVNDLPFDEPDEPEPWEPIVPEEDAPAEENGEENTEDTEGDEE